MLDNLEAERLSCLRQLAETVGNTRPPRPLTEAQHTHCTELKQRANELRLTQERLRKTELEIRGNKT